VRRDLAADEVLVRWLETEQVPDADWPHLEALLDDAERARAQRFRFAHDRQSHVAAHALVRSTLSTLADRAPASWRFATNRHGKPEAVLREGEPRLRVNLSHSRGLVAVAVALESDIGIDVEWMRRGNLTRELGLEVFAPAECEAIGACGAEELDETLFAFWTLKEAYVKAVGEGFSIRLDSFAFSLDPLAIAFSNPLADDPSEWCFRRFCPTPDHAMALAVRRATAPEILVERVVARDLLRAGVQRG
jgi:4'-phosphopantetheinyl transferase